MGFDTHSERRVADGPRLSDVLLDADGPLTFDQIAAAAPTAGDGEVAGWLGHAVAEGMVLDMGADAHGARLFGLRARGRRIFSARRRREERG